MFESLNPEALIRGPFRVHSHIPVLCLSMMLIYLWLANALYSLFHQRHLQLLSSLSFLTRIN